MTREVSVSRASPRRPSVSRRRITMPHRPSTPRLLAGATAVATLVGLATFAPFTSGVAGAAAFGAPVVVSGDNASEPGIDVAPDGTLYVNAPVGVLSNIPGSPSNVYRSSDGGATWTKL